MTIEEIRKNKPDGAMFYCRHPVTCFDRPNTYLKVRFKILFGWNGNKWTPICFPFGSGDEINNLYTILKPL